MASKAGATGTPNVFSLGRIETPKIMFTMHDKDLAATAASQRVAALPPPMMPSSALFSSCSHFSAFGRLVPPFSLVNKRLSRFSKVFRVSARLVQEIKHCLSA
jgi:hypothetical protein